MQTAVLLDQHALVVVGYRVQGAPAVALAVAAGERVHLQQPRGDAGAALAGLQGGRDAVQTGSVLSGR